MTNLVTLKLELTVTVKVLMKMKVRNNLKVKVTMTTTMKLKYVLINLRNEGDMTENIDKKNKMAREITNFKATVTMIDTITVTEATKNTIR